MLELLAGKASIHQLSMRFGVLEDTVVKWRDEAVDAMANGFRRGTAKSQRERELEQENKTLKAAFTDLAYATSSPRRPCATALLREGGRPDEPRDIARAGES